MITLTRTSGELCSLDPALIERIEGRPTTVVHLTDGARYCVSQTVDQVIDAVRRFRAEVLTSAWRLVDSGGGTAATDGRAPHPTGALAVGAADPG